MKTYQDIKSAAHIDVIINYTETLLGIRFKSVKKSRYNAMCPFHADTKDSFMVYLNKNDEVRFHCFGACKGDWDIYDMIMLRKKSRFRTAHQVWSEHLGVKVFKSNDGSSSCIPEPNETPEPDVSDPRIAGSSTGALKIPPWGGKGPGFTGKNKPNAPVV